jgi:hypothetical protein
LYIPKTRLVLIFNLTFLTICEIFSIFFMQHWGNIKQRLIITAPIEKMSIT